MARFSLFVLLLCIAYCLAQQTCQNVLATDPTSFVDGSQKSDCDFENPVQTPATDAEHAIDLYWVNEAHKYAATNMPSLPFGAALVDSRTNKLIAIGSNMFNSLDDLFAQQVVSHAETTVITNATITTLPDSWNATTGRRRPHPDWKHMTLYGNIETCPMCAQGAIWRGLRRMVFGARASELAAKRCWSQSTLSVYEVVAHSAHWAPFSVVRGPMVELESTILQAFSNSCKAPTPTPAPLFTCTARYTINSQPPQWSTGMDASITISVSDPSLLQVNNAPGWKVSFTAKGNGVEPAFRITNSWNNGGIDVSTSSVGTSVYTVVNANYNARNPSFGFNAATTISSPLNNICGVTINGVACSVGTPSTINASC